MWRKGNLFTLLVEMYIGAATTKNKTSGYWLPSLRKHHQWSLPPRLFSGNEHLCILRVSLFSGAGHLRFSTWGEPGQSVSSDCAGSRGEGVVGKLETTRADVSLPHLVASHCTHTPCELSLGFFSICPSGPPTRQEGLSPPCGTPELGCTVLCLTCSVPIAGTISLFFWVPSQEQRSQLSLFFLSYPMMDVSFFRFWLYKSPSASFQLVFTENYCTHRCIFDVLVEGSELHVFLFCHLDLSSLVFTCMNIVYLFIILIFLFQ